MAHVTAPHFHGRRLGVVGRSIPDVRDWRIPAAARASDLPVLPVYLPGRPPQDQGSQGSCLPHACVHAMETEAYITHGVSLDVSQAFLYQEIRGLRGQRNVDSGSFMRDAIRVCRDTGVCSAHTMPYDADDWQTVPSRLAYDEARRNRIVEFYATPHSTDVLMALARNLPVVISFAVYTNFAEVGQDGKWRQPRGNVEGGHAVCITGAALRGDSGVDFLVANSWLDWGMPHPQSDLPQWHAHTTGYFWMPDYALNDGEIVWDQFALSKYGLLGGTQ